MKKWRFISNQNSTIVGINDAGIETFTANVNRSLVREIIQNSLDAKLEGYKGPVQVEFHLFNIKREKIPDINTLHNVIKKCIKSNKNEQDAQKFFLNADKILSNDEISILRISDNHTIGLEGSDTCEKGTSWSRLVKENGSSNKGKNSGGSFGIGKSAAFACSDLRTVFYSSLDSKGLVSNFGVAKLISFLDDYNNWTTGTGYYSEDNKFKAIPELAEFDESYKRKDSGTDIYVLGMHKNGNFEEEFIRAILLDFLVSIIYGKLEVILQGKRINSETLPKYMSKLNEYENTEIKDLINYYHLLTSPNPTIHKISLNSKIYGEKYGFKDNDCVLYLKEDDSYNRKVLITRSAGMRILEQNRISGSIGFTGVMIINGAEMNESFKAMEVPSHDAWEPGRCRGQEKYYAQLLKDFKKYIKQCVTETFGKVTTDSVDAYGASDFLPDQIQEDGSQGLVKNDLTNKIKKLLGKKVEPTRKKTKSVDVTKSDISEDGSGGGPGDKNGPKPGHGPHPGPGIGPYEGGKNILDDENKDEQVNYKEIKVKKRLLCVNEKTGSYILNFSSPSKASKGKLEFNVAGEQSDFELPIKQAKIISDTTTAKIDRIENNLIYFTDLKKGESIKLELDVDFDSYCMMEVDYYANKK